MTFPPTNGELGGTGIGPGIRHAIRIRRMGKKTLAMKEQIANEKTGVKDFCLGDPDTEISQD